MSCYTTQKTTQDHVTGTVCFFTNKKIIIYRGESLYVFHRDCIIRIYPTRPVHQSLFKLKHGDIFSEYTNLRKNKLVTSDVGYNQS